MRRLEGSNHRETALFDLGRLTLGGASSGGDQLRAAPDVIAAGLQLDYVELFEHLPSNDAVRLIGSNGPDGPAIGSVERLSPDSLLADTRLRSGEPVVISNWQDETRLKLPMALRDARVMTSVALAINVGHGERIYGFLCAHSREPRTFSEDEILFLETVELFLGCAFAVARSAMLDRTFVENTPDVVVWFDGDLRIIYANPASEQVTGTAAGLLIGKTSGVLGIVEPIVPTWELLLGQVWRTGREQSCELTISTPTGERLFESRIVPETGPDGSVRSLLTISRDVTAQRHALSERLALYQQLVAQQNRVQELTGRLAQVGEHALDRASPTSPLQQLSDRERRILHLLAEGRTNREIGAEIGLSAGTVKNQVACILAKLNVADRTQAAVRAVMLGLVDSASKTWPADSEPSWDRSRSTNAGR